STSIFRSRECLAIPSRSPLDLLTAVNPARLACVMRTLVTQPTDFPPALNFCKPGLLTLPSAFTFTDPFGTFTPPPHAELPAAESVTKALADDVSTKDRATKLS